MSNFIGNGPGWLYQNSYIGNGTPSDGVSGLSFILNGGVPWYALHTRKGKGFSILGGGNPFTVAEDVPMFALNTGKREYINYADPNEPSGFPSGVNQPALSLLADDISKASYQSNGTTDIIDVGDVLDTSTCSILMFEFYVRIVSIDAVTKALVTKRNSHAGLDVGYYISLRSDGKVRLHLSDGTNTYVLETTVLSVDTNYKVKAVIDQTANENELFVDDVSVGTVDITGNLGFGNSINFQIMGINGDRSPSVYMWDVCAHCDGTLFDCWTLSEYRRDTVVKSLNGNDGTATRNVNLMLSENDSWGYPVNEKAPTYKGNTLQDIYSNDGTTIIRNFKIADISSDFVFARKEDETPILWMEGGTGLIKFEDDSANVAVSTSGIVADTYYTFWESHVDGKSWITFDGTKGTEADFTGIDVGNRALYGADSPVLHRVTDVVVSQ